MDYTYTADDLPLTITESGTLSGSATVTFTYDNGRRLTREVRTGATPHDLADEYDAGGNRTVKTDALNNRRTEYHYDTLADNQDAWGPADFRSNNNRLEYYEVYDTSGQSQELLSTTWYYYTREWGTTYADIGNVTRIVTKPEASAQYSAVRFGYAMNDRTLTHVVGETWDNASVCPPVNYNIEWAREFRYDGARARYLNRELSPAGLLMNPPQFNSLSDIWTDYDGDSAYGDFEVTPGYPPTVTNRRSYEPGLAQVDPWRSSGSTATDYLMSDHLGTTRGVIQPNNIPTDASVYTAFGERISGTNHRFGYVGSFGYQASGEYPFLHVGARYYDPATGRFLQRDPMGIAGGRNVYEYASSIPSAVLDPLGLWVIQVGIGGSVTIPPLGGGWFSACFAFDISIYFGSGGVSLGGTVGAGLGAGGYVGGGIIGGGYSGNVGNMSGPSIEGGIDTPVGGGSVVKGPGYTGGQGSFGPGHGVAIRGTGNRTWTTPPLKLGPYRPGIGACFPSDTPVLTMDGPIEIQKLVSGMHVVSGSPTSCMTTEDQITHEQTYLATSFVAIALEGELLRATSAHPFWVVGKGWVSAGNLVRGDHLVSERGDEIAIRDISSEHLSEPVAVFNITVEGSHTYYVGASRVLVHNKQP